MTLSSQELMTLFSVRIIAGLSVPLTKVLAGEMGIPINFLSCARESYVVKARGHSLH